MNKNLLLLLFYTLFSRSFAENRAEKLHSAEAIFNVKKWSEEIGKVLYDLSRNVSRKDRMLQSFSSLKDKIYVAEGGVLIEDIAGDLRKAMFKKMEAVQKIADYAEILSYHRPSSPIKPDSTFNYYNADTIQKTQNDYERLKVLEEEIEEGECVWYCQQKSFDLRKFPDNIINETVADNLFKGKIFRDCDCDRLPDRERPWKHYEWLPMNSTSKYAGRLFNEQLSVVKLPANVYDRDEEVLQGVRWSEGLDIIFKRNLANDPSLKYQYFTSPLGYMRHFPAMQWSQEQYDRTYDPRTRSWYTEAMTSPKDIMILLDRSGSMEGGKRQLSAQIVNNILDTLNDNDFVNIYTFTNTTEPLVPCFKDTLVQANEENLRLLRESLDVYEIKFVADISIGLEKAFSILSDFREKGLASTCNQAIMLISEGLDYDYKAQIFNESNWQHGTPVRIFTYELQTKPRDSQIMEQIACQNRGYFVNVSVMAEVREKVLNYLNVMSRPINLDANKGKQDFIWSYLYIDLTDRRYSNWLWRKYEGNRQRQVFLDHAKREYIRLGKVLTSDTYILLQEEHDYEKYQSQIENDFDYMTTVSLPVYDRREGKYDLVGVAGVDFSISRIKSLIPHYKLGVNGYAFIVTNNGYILWHPDHRTEFERIPKPTFNRVDLLEVEILDDDREPREFGPRILHLRERIVNLHKGVEQDFNVKYTLDDLKRIVLAKRRYYFTKMGPFSLGIALPSNYGLMIVNTTKIKDKHKSGILRVKNWRVHPQWVYCSDDNEHTIETPEEAIVRCLDPKNKRKRERLFTSLLFDAEATEWFGQRFPDNLSSKYWVKAVFVATHSGLTRFKLIDGGELGEEINHFRALDEDWYQRTVEENFNKAEDMFIYSVPFEISGFENSTMVTSTSTIFVNGSFKKAPVAVVGLQFNHQMLYRIYNEITKRIGNVAKCDSEDMTCFILDNNAYVVLSDEIEYTGRYIGDIVPEVMYELVKHGVFKSTRMYDYQAICHKLPLQLRKKRSAKNSATTFRRMLENLLQITNWALATILFLIKTAMAGPDYQSIKNDTLAFEKLEISKTFPTPCDQEMYLFTLNDDFKSSVRPNVDSSFCSWLYVVERIPHSNLLFLAYNPKCRFDISYNKTTTPIEISYDNETYDSLASYIREPLPCYIEKTNKYRRRIYMKCYNRSAIDDELNNKDRLYCGHTWE